MATLPGAKARSPSTTRLSSGCCSRRPYPYRYLYPYPSPNPNPNPNPKPNQVLLAPRNSAFAPKHNQVHQDMTLTLTLTLTLTPTLI